MQDPTCAELDKVPQPIKDLSDHLFNFTQVQDTFAQK